MDRMRQKVESGWLSVGGRTTRFHHECWNSPSSAREGSIVDSRGVSSALRRHPRTAIEKDSDPDGVIFVWTHAWGSHEQPCGLQENTKCVPRSGGVARRASLHAPATRCQAFGLKNSMPNQGVCDVRTSWSS
jgi:hypothetical protein